MPLTLIPPTVPEDYCNLTQQEQINLLIKGIVISGSADPSILFQSTAPGIDDRDKAWGRTDASGRFLGKVYTYFSGFWVSLHPYSPSGDIRILFLGPSGDIGNFDGGSSGDPVGDYTGPMWERDTNFNDRIPMGVGASLATTVDTDFGDTDASITIGSTNLPEHFHFMANSTQINTGALLSAGGFAAYIGGGQGQENYVLQESPSDANVGKTSTVGESSPTDLDILNPVRGVFVIKRTARIYYTAS